MLKSQQNKTKFDLMDEIAGSFGSTYAAANWLKTANKDLNKTPAEAMKNGEINEVFEALNAFSKK